MNVIKKQRQVALVYATKACEVGEVHLQSFLTSALDGRKWSVSRPRPLYRGIKAPISDRKGACVGPRVSLDVHGEGQHLFAPTGNVVQPVP
jgi:hypothetical protein